MGLLFFLLVPASLWYLGSRAEITRLLWSRYPKRLAHFMDCAACTGFWWGAAFYLVWTQGYGKPIIWLYTMGYTPLFALTSVVTTPLAAFLLDQALFRLGTVEAPDDGAE